MKETVDDRCLKRTEMVPFKICQAQSCTLKGCELKITSYSSSQRFLEPGSTWPPSNRNFRFAVIKILARSDHTCANVESDEKIYLLKACRPIPLIDVNLIKRNRECVQS